jgi:hypothetical protein
MLASASLPLKAEKANKDKAMNALARLLARKSSSSLLVGGGGGRRVALAGRWLATRCVLVFAHGSCVIFRSAVFANDGFGALSCVTLRFAVIAVCSKSTISADFMVSSCAIFRS